MRDPEEPFRELLGLGEDLEAAAGDILLQEGEAGDAVLLLLSGGLEVLQRTPSGEPVFVRALGPGSLVGELACLDGQPRSATVMATEPARLRRVSGDVFRDLLKKKPHLYEGLFWQQSQRVRSLTRQVTQNHVRAITDPLTRLYNYGFFWDRLGLEIERAAQMGDHLAVVLFDIDHFKHFNDTNGHPAGNEALVRVAELLRRTARRGDIVARFGGEEFVLLLYGASRREGCQLGEQCRSRVEATDVEGGSTQPLGRLTVSGGVAAFPDDGGNPSDLLKAADVHLYRAKAEGRNRVLAHESAAG